MKKNLSFILAVAMLLLSILTACSTETTPGDSTVTSDGVEGSVKDTLMWGVEAEAASLDPSTSKDTVTHAIMYQIYDTLVKEDHSDYAKLIPGLAESWTFSNDNKEVIFKLRENVKFHNGDVMTAEDVQFSLQRSLESSYSSSISEAIDHFEKVDDMTVKCVLKYPYSPILDVMTNLTYGIVSKRAVEEAEANNIDFARNPVGTGAYKIVEWKSGDALILERFDDYYDGPAKIKNIIFKLVPDAASGSIALEDGTLDIYYPPANSDYDHLKQVESLSYVECPGVGLRHITFNVRDGIFTNKKIRQAIAYALNRDDIIIGGAYGYAVATNCLVPTSIFGYLDDFKWYEQDIEKAKQLLAEAGYPDGFDITFSMEGSPMYMQPAEVVQDQLRKIGINVTFNKMERAAYLEDVAGNMNFDVSLRMTSATIRDADYLLTRRFHSTMLGGGNNYSGYSNPEVDALIEKARAESSNDKRLEIYRQIYGILKEDVPLIPLYTNMNLLFHNAKLKNVFPHPVDRYNVSKMYFEE
jgi:peptide/nickel transport system substrate-binding protein